MQYQKCGIQYRPANESKSELYVEDLPLFNSARVEIPNNPGVITQPCGLERRTRRGTGRDIIDHAPNAQDDLAIVVVGALVERGVEIYCILPSSDVRRLPERLRFSF